MPDGSWPDAACAQRICRLFAELSAGFGARAAFWQRYADSLQDEEEVSASSIRDALAAEI
jgi:hypothetical protein